MTKVTYNVLQSPEPNINQIMRSLDLFEAGAGVAVKKGYTVTWKDGEVVDKTRIDRAATGIKQGLEKLGYDCFSIEAGAPTQAG